MSRAIGNAVRRRVWRSLFASHQRALGSFFLDPRDYIGAERIIMGDRYEGGLLAIVADVIDRLELGSGAALDVGANIGNHACFFAPRFRHLICVEPGETASRVLEANLGASGNRNFEVHRVALGNEARSGVLDHRNSENLGASVVRAVDSEADGAFDIVRGDHLVKRAGVEDLRFIKIDVEGAEVDVVDGLSETLAAQKPVVCVEVIEEHHWIEVQRLLLAAGYEKWLVMVPEIEPKGILERLWVTLRGRRLRLEPLPPRFREGGFEMILCMTKPQHDRLMR